MMDKEFSSGCAVKHSNHNPYTLVVHISVPTEGGSAGGAPCVFPFKHWVTWYLTCTGKFNSEMWCSTTEDYNNDLKWGFCIGKYG